MQDSVNQVGQELTRRGLDVQPTLTIRPGFPVRVIMSRDLVLRPYQPLFFDGAMSTKLRLGPLPTTDTIKVTITLPAALNTDLQRYSQLHAQAWGESVDVAHVSRLIVDRIAQCARARPEHR